MFAGMAGFLLDVLKKSLIVGLTCIFALGGAVVGTISGAIAGQTTETGFLRGAGIGVLAGAIVAIELFESMINEETSSKMQIGIFNSLVSGKIFREWVSPAMLKAYQWQIGTLETSSIEISDIFDIDGTKGLSSNCIQKLPKFNLSSMETMDQCGEKICCSICLQDFTEGNPTRRLPKCRHFFHLDCIDGWLVIQGSCPVCRDDVLETGKTPS